MRNAAVLQQTDHGGHAHGDAGGVQEVSIFFFGHGDALQHEYDGAARGADVDGLIRGVQHEHRLVKGVAIAVRMHARGKHGERKMRPHAAGEIVQAQRHGFLPVNLLPVNSQTFYIFTAYNFVIVGTIVVIVGTTLG